MTYRCKECRGSVDKNYDHVGACSVAGRCTGTFMHRAHRSYPPYCTKQHKDLTHSEVEAT